MQKLAEPLEERVDLGRVEGMFHRLLVTDRTSQEFSVLYEECHRLIGLAMTQELGETDERGAG